MVRKIVLCFIVWASALSSSARNIPECVRVKLDSMIDDGLKCRAFPRGFARRGRPDGICYARHYGCHDYSGKRPVADGDLFRRSFMYQGAFDDFRRDAVVRSG